jgi:hypothetical protein
MPMAQPELPHELAKARSGAEADLLAFVRRYGLLGYERAWSAEERAGVAALLGGDEEKSPGPGDPVSWFVAHARTVGLVLDLLGSLREGDAAVAQQVDRLVAKNDGAEVLRVVTAARGYLRPTSWDGPKPSTRPRDDAVALVQLALEPNLTGVIRTIGPRIDEEGGALQSWFRPRNLLDSIYWHLADSAEGGWVRRCADPECGAFFVAKSDRVKYCPPPMGYRGVSPCMNRHKQRVHRTRHGKRSTGKGPP